MSRRSLVQLALFGLVIGLVVGAVVYLPRINGYRSVVPQNNPVLFQSGADTTRGPGQWREPGSSPPGRVQVLVARVLRSLSLPLVVAVLGAVVLVAIAALVAGSLGSP